MKNPRKQRICLEFGRQVSKHCLEVRLVPVSIGFEKEQSIIGDSSAENYIDTALANTASPHPVCIGQADEAVRAFFTEWQRSDRVSSLKMFSLAWGSLRCATMVTRMGMTTQAYPIQRQALEAIVYGILFRFDSEFHELWKNRHVDHIAASKFKRNHWKRALEIVEQKDKHLRSVIVQNYQGLIDLGAHPNPASLDMMSDYEISEGADEGTAVYSMILGQPFVDMAHLQTISNYLVLLDAMPIVWPDRAAKLEFLPVVQEVRISSLEFIRHVRKTTESGLAT